MRSLRGVVPHLAIPLLAVLAVVSMHGGSASAHVCPDGAGHPPAASTAHVDSRHGMDASPGGHQHGPNDLQDRTGTGSHCATAACTAIVLAPTPPRPAAARLTSLVTDVADGLPPAASPSPDPPVPRTLLHA